MQVTCRVIVNYTVEAGLGPSFQCSLSESMDPEDRTWLTLNLTSALSNHLENRSLEQPAPLAVPLWHHSILQFFLL